MDKEITPDEVNKAIKHMKSGKAAGIDMITTEMIKSGLDILINPMTKLFNTILRNGIYPNEWSYSLITPIHKSGPTENPHNYRGVAVSNCTSKIFAKILTDRIEEYMTDNNLWTKNQNGFKKDVRY